MAFPQAASSRSSHYLNRWHRSVQSLLLEAVSKTIQLQLQLMQLQQRQRYQLFCATLWRCVRMLRSYGSLVKGEVRWCEFIWVTCGRHEMLCTVLRCTKALLVGVGLCAH
jgi:hypothetical protein